MNEQIKENFKKNFPNRATTDLFERKFYERDLAPLPNFLIRPIAATLPDIVIRPQNTEEVAQIVKTANKNNIPITPRAGGSTVYFNAVCTQKGIALDLTGLDQIISLDAVEKTVRVGAGLTWSQLERFLNNNKFSLYSYPSSAHSATVGGWLAMMGYGIGSLKYGHVLNQVVLARTVFPDGTVKDLTLTSSPPVDWLRSSEGTLGIVTEVELKIKPYYHELWHALAGFDSAEKMQLFIEKTAKLIQKPFNLHFSDPKCIALKSRLGLCDVGAAGVYRVSYDADGSAAEIEQASQGYLSCLAEAGGNDFPGEEALREWDERFFASVLKREAPSLLGAEILLPIENLAIYLKDIDALEKKLSLGLKSYGHIVTASQAMVMTMFNADERDIVGYIQGLALVKKLHDISARHFGMPYGIGLWNTPYLNRIFTKEELSEIIARKKSLDPKNIMNPGKVYNAPLFLKPALFKPGMDVLAATINIYRGKLGGWRE